MCRPLVLIAVATLSCAGWSASLAAQVAVDSSPPPLSIPGVLVGQRVRVHVDDAGDTRVVGRLRSADDTALVLLVRAPTDSMTILLSSVRWVDVSRRSHALGALRGAGIGLAVGAVGGAALGAATFDEDGSDFIVSNRRESALLGAIVLGVPAMVVGAVVGVFVPYERWVPVDDLRVGLAPGPRSGVAVAAQVRF